MALFPGRSLILALAAGAAGGAVAALLRQNDGRARPAIKSAVRAGLLMFEQARETFAEFTETATDVLAEAQAELEAERRAARAEPRSEEHVVPFETRATPEAERKAHG